MQFTCTFVNFYPWNEILSIKLVEKQNQNARLIKAIRLVKLAL